MLIVIEGLDGAGKRTLTEGLRAGFEAGGKSVATVAFPRYGQSIHADVADEALHGEHGRLHQDADGEVVDWVHRLEFGRLGLPKPDYQLLLDVSPELAGERARSREAGDLTRTRDAYERDGGLQQRTGAVYAGLAAAGWAGRWLVLGPQSRPADVVAALG